MYNNLDSSASPPPPAYSAQEFDRKVSRALEVSVTTPQPSTPGEVWEEWDEEAHRMAAARLAEINANTANGSSNRNSFGPRQRNTEPLRVAKRAPLSSPPPSSKPRPSWYAEAGLGASSSQAGSSSAVQSNFTSARPSPSPAPVPSQVIQHNIPNDDDSDDHSNPPPPFAHIAPSLDGPSYHPHQSPPPSPLRSPPSSNASLPQHLHPSFTPSFDQRLHQPYTPPAPPRQPSPLPPVIPRQQSPMTTQPGDTDQRVVPPLARMHFNPSVAYTPPSGLAPSQHHQAPANASEFYTSAVSAHLSSANLPQRYTSNIPRQTTGGRYNSSQTPSYSQPQPQSMQPLGGYYHSSPVPQAPWPPPAGHPMPMLPGSGGVPYQQYPAYNNYGGDTGRWATSEHELTRNFQ